jgi:hypothetical protein
MSSNSARTRSSSALTRSTRLVYIPMTAPTPFRVEVCQPLLWRGFLLPSGEVLPPSNVGGSPLFSVQSVFGCPPLLSSLEVSEFSRGGGFEEVGGSPEAVIDLSFCFQTLGVSHEGNVKGFLDLTAQVRAKSRGFSLNI